MSHIPDLLSTSCKAAEGYLERGLIKEAAEVLSLLPDELQNAREVIVLRMCIHLRLQEYTEASEMAKVLCFREPGKTDLTQLVTRYHIFADMMAQSAAWLELASKEGEVTATMHHLMERYQTAQRNFEEAKLALSKGIDSYLIS